MLTFILRSRPPEAKEIMTRAKEEVRGPSMRSDKAGMWSWWMVGSNTGL